MQFTPIKAMCGLFGLVGRESDGSGFRPHNVCWNDDFDRYKARHPDGDPVGVNHRAIEALDELIRLCLRQGIRIILVYSPEYYENYAVTLNRDRVFSEFAALAARHGVTFIDYSRTPVTLDRQYFYNSQHLNAKGARLFSVDLAERLKRYRLAEIGTARTTRRE
jgi:hypothetical protein